MPNYYSESVFILQVFFRKKFRIFLTFWCHSSGLLEKQPGFSPGTTAFLRTHIHQHDIRPHFAYPAPGNNIVILPAEEAEKPAGTRHHDGRDVPRRDLHAGIRNIPQPPPVRHADNFLTMQLCKFRGHTQTPLTTIKSNR